MTWTHQHQWLETRGHWSCKPRDCWWDLVSPDLVSSCVAASWKYMAGSLLQWGGKAWFCHDELAPCFPWYLGRVAHEHAFVFLSIISLLSFKPYYSCSSSTLLSVQVVKLEIKWSKKLLHWKNETSNIFFLAEFPWLNYVGILFAIAGPQAQD